MHIKKSKLQNAKKSNIKANSAKKAFEDSKAKKPQSSSTYSSQEHKKYDNHSSCASDTAVEMLEIASNSINMLYQNNSFLYDIVEKYNNNFYLICNDLLQDCSNVVNSLLNTPKTDWLDTMKLTHQNMVNSLSTRGYQIITANLASWLSTQDQVIIPALKQTNTLMDELLNAALRCDCKFY